MHFDVSVSSPYEKWGGTKAIGEAAKHAEAVGLYGVQFGEHVVTPGVWYDNFVLASHLATLTRKLRLTFSVLVVPYRPCIQTAKLIATLDVISQGRINVTMTAGWMQHEFEALGIPFETRGPLTDEYIRAMKALWTEERPSFQGRFVSFPSIVFEPKCVQKPHVPIWIGGSKARALRRVAELGDGWSPDAGTPDEMAARIATIKGMAKTYGRDSSAFTFAGTLGMGKPTLEMSPRVLKYYPERPLETPEQAIDYIRRYQQAGVSHLSLRFAWESPADYMRWMEWFAAKVMPAFR